MVDSSNDYLIIGGQDPYGMSNDYAIANRANYDYGGQPGGAQAAQNAQMQAYQDAIARTAPSTNYSLADTGLGQANDARQQQLGMYNQLAAQAAGGTTAAQQQVSQNTDDSIAAQQSLANSGRGFGAMAAAPMIASQRASQLQLQGNQQLALQQAQDMASARDMQANLASQLSSQDSSTRAQAQQRASNTASLQDQQAALNDQMAQYYYNQRYRIGSAQLQANEGYSAQDAANRIGYSNLQNQQNQVNMAYNQANINAATNAAATGLTTLGTQIGKSKSQAQDDNYSNGIFQESPY